MSLGVHFPPKGNAPGERVGFTVPMPCLRVISPPPSLAEVMRCSRDGWKRALGLLIEQDPFFSDIRVYGSHMWELLTGIAYVREASDIDLAMPVRSLEEILRIGLSLNAWEEATGFTADGEFVFPGGSAAAWRECVPPPRGSLLLKSVSSVRLCEPDDLFSLFDNGQRASR